MQSEPSPSWSGPPPTSLGPIRSRLPRDVLIGFLLASASLVFAGLSRAWNYFGIRPFLDSGFTTYLEIEISLSVAEFLSLQLGLFFIFRGVLRNLPSVRPWSRVGPLLILIGALFVAGFGLLELSLRATSNYAAFPSGLEWLFLGLLALNVAASLATTLGLILSLFAVTQGLLLRTALMSNPPP